MSIKKSKLALLGGRKTTKEKIPHFNWPPITRAVEKKVVEQLHTAISIYDKSGVFGEFEGEFSKYHNREYSLLCSSGTLAIHSMYVAAGLKDGDEVICPAYTFFATVTPLMFTGAKPILCDCDENGNIDPLEIRKKITKRTRAVVVTHMWGIPCQMGEIVKICNENNLLLLEDCSHAHGALYEGKTVGSFGDLAAWSLQGQKSVSGGEGGILATNNKEFYYKALLLGHYNKRCKQEIPKDHNFYKYATTGMGLKYRAHPLAVAIALETFKNLDKYLTVRRSFVRKIFKELKEVKGLRIPNISQGTEPSWYSLVFQYCPDELGGLSREKFFEALQAEGLVEADCPNSTSPLNLLSLFQNPTELFPAYKNQDFNYRPGDFPVAEAFYQNAIKLPVWAMKKDIKIVNAYITGIKKVINNHKDLL